MELFKHSQSLDQFLQLLNAIISTNTMLSITKSIELNNRKLKAGKKIKKIFLERSVYQNTSKGKILLK